MVNGTLGEQTLSLLLMMVDNEFGKHKIKKKKGIF